MPARDDRDHSCDAERRVAESRWLAIEEARDCEQDAYPVLHPEGWRPCRARARISSASASSRKPTRVAGEDGTRGFHPGRAEAASHDPEIIAHEFPAIGARGFEARALRGGFPSRTPRFRCETAAANTKYSWGPEFTGVAAGRRSACP